MKKLLSVVVVSSSLFLLTNSGDAFAFEKNNSLVDTKLAEQVSEKATESQAIKTENNGKLAEINEKGKREQEKNSDNTKVLLKNKGEVKKEQVSGEKENRTAKNVAKKTVVSSNVKKDEIQPRAAEAKAVVPNAELKKAKWKFPNVTIDIPYHGNWGGPGHGGKTLNELPPVDKLDEAFMYHDLAYMKYGYFSKKADEELYERINATKHEMKPFERFKANVAVGIFKVMGWLGITK